MKNTDNMDNLSSFALFDNAVTGQYFLLDGLVFMQKISFLELAHLDEILQDGWRKNYYSAMLIEYEFHLTILWYRNKTELNEEELNNVLSKNNSEVAISKAIANISEDEYKNKIEVIKEHILAGDNYQTNFTYLLKFNAYGEVRELYRKLRQKAAYQALIKLSNDEYILSFSPELFFEIKDRRIETKPMKGTISIAKQPDELRDEKNLAENTMIVDLMRNDLGKICEIGTVKVENPFEIIRFNSVYQMISTVFGKLKDGISFAEIFAALFPSGSITGAPKLKTMEIIDKLEKDKRGIYTGSIGYISKDYAKFNVAIRTISLTRIAKRDEFSAIYGVGGGITILSNPNEEYLETKLKAELISNFSPDFAIFETMKVEKHQIKLLKYHLNRLEKSSQELNFSLDKNILHLLDKYIQSNCDKRKNYRLKLSLSSNGIEINATELDNIAKRQKIIISDVSLENRNYLRRYKTDRRKIFDEWLQKASKRGAFDAIFFNQDGYLLEGARTFVAVKLHSQWYLPPLSLDILPSITREMFIEKYRAQGKLITEKEFLSAEEIIIGNALRGFLQAEILL
ncbi:MAG: bifunctional anthranilate synthase component I family protein/aminotransferase class IV [Cardiobacteriaceae bacterium]|nr:bifunctional anthranilate synthase component I family protein/aminotransferase class IV [Cardiobacteriaceae bacterium]